MNTKKLKPFSLEAALEGEPVMMRNGKKAFVRHHETELNVSGIGQLLGYGEGAVVNIVLSWRKDGAHAQPSYNIIGMYPKTRVINGFEVPAPEVVEPAYGCEYFTPCILSEEFYDPFAWRGDYYDNLMLKRGLVFLSKEGSIANAKAMLGINPYEDSE